MTGADRRSSIAIGARLMGTVFAAALMVALTWSTAQAVPISIEYTFSPITVEFDGVIQSTGDIEMTIVTDTSNPNLGTSFSSFQNFYAADVFFTAPLIGLNSALVTSPTFLYFGTSVTGFTDAVGGFGTIFTAFIGPNLAFGNPFDLSTLVVPQGPIAKTGTEFRTGNQITFDNGSFFDSGQFTSFNAQANTVSVVPEPSTALLLGAGLLGLAVAGRRRKA